MPTVRRLERINQLLKKQIGEIFLREINFNDALVTITDVLVSGNLQEAKIRITVLPENQEKKVLDILFRNIFDIQQVLNRKLNMRPVPKIIFEIDRGTKSEYEIDRLLSAAKLKQK